MPEDFAIWVEQVWGAYDTNLDGRLTKGEILAWYPDEVIVFWWFAMADLDRDGYFEQAEISALMPFESDVRAALDWDGNGVIQFYEASGYMSEELFGQFDKDDNGLLNCYDIVDIF